MAGNTNQFKAAEERKRQETEERKKREAEERAKREAEGVSEENKEVVMEETVKVPSEEVKSTVVPVQENVPTAPAAPTFNPVMDAVNALREQEDTVPEKLEKKVPVNIMLKPSLKRKMEQDIRNKKIKSLSGLITDLLEAYYK